MNERAPILEAREVTKRFPGVLASFSSSVASGNSKASANATYQAS